MIEKAPTLRRGAFFCGWKRGIDRMGAIGE